MGTQVKAELLLASKNRATGIVLYTWRLTFNRSILSEINTHRMASRNTSSSRAIPSKKMRAAVLNDPFIPVTLGVNQKGMQAGAEITGWKRKAILAVLKVGRYPVVFQSWLLEKLGAHKQIVNRYIEAYSWCTQIFSVTEVENLFLLRNHSAAEPHFHILAAQMQAQAKLAEDNFSFMEKHKFSRLTNEVGDAYLYQIISPGNWHLPLVFIREINNYSIPVLKKISSARSARTSYTLLETGKVNTIEADMTLCDRLFGGAIKHLSPTEHAAQAMDSDEFFANFKSYRQYRKEVENA